MYTAYWDCSSSEKFPSLQEINSPRSRLTDDAVKRMVEKGRRENIDEKLVQKAVERVRDFERFTGKGHIGLDGSHYKISTKNLTTSKNILGLSIIKFES